MLILTGAIIGGLAGYLYWKYVGCATGNCYLASNPYRMTLYGIVMGSLLFSNIFK